MEIGHGGKVEKLTRPMSLHFFILIHIDNYYVNYCNKINLYRFCCVNYIHCSLDFGFFTIFGTINID